MTEPIARSSNSSRRLAYAGVAGPVVLALASLPWWLGARAVAGAAQGVPTPASVVVATDQTHQVMDGFGMSLRVFEDPHVTDLFSRETGKNSVVLTAAQEDEVIDRLHRDLGLTRIRPILEPGVEVENDNGNPDNTNLGRFNFSGKRNDAHVEYVRRARLRGATTFFAAPIFLEQWMGRPRDNPDVGEYVEWALAIVRRWRELGVEMPYYSVFNEPGNPETRMPAEFMRQVIRRMGPRLAAEGFKTRFVIPDDFGPAEAAANSRVILQDEAARRYVGALATHLYSGYDLTEMAALSRQYNLPLWMTEFSREDAFYFAALMSDLITRYDVSAIDYLFGFFGEYSRNTHLLSLLYNSPKSPHYDPSRPVAYTGYRLEKMYYTIGQFSRFVRPGARRVDATSSHETLKISAYRSGEDLVIVAVNQEGGDKRTQFVINTTAAITQLRAVRTTDREDWADLGPMDVSGATFTADLPARSVTTFVTAAPGPGPAAPTPGPQIPGAGGEPGGPPRVPPKGPPPQPDVQR